MPVRSTTQNVACAKSLDRYSLTQFDEAPVDQVMVLPCAIPEAVRCQAADVRVRIAVNGLPAYPRVWFQYYGESPMHLSAAAT